MSEQGGPADEQMRLPSVAEVVLSSAQLLVTLAADAIASREQLEDAQLAIDTLEALLPMVERLVSAEQMRQYRRAVSELQLAFVDASKPAAEATPMAPREPVVETPERPKIWTPGGDV